MGIYLRGNIYWFRIGRKIQQSTGTSKRRLAERIYAKALTDVQEGRWFQNQIKRKTLKEMIDRYRREYTENKDYFQKARDETIFKQFKSYFGEDATLQDIENTVGGYEQFRKAQGRKPATIHKELSLLRRMFNVARKQWKWKIENPVSDIELPKLKNERVRYLSHQEYKKLFRALDRMEETWLKPFVIIALDTGLRQNNIYNLMWSEVDMSRRMIIINAEKMKNNDYIGIPLTERAYNTLRELQKVKCIEGCVFHENGNRLHYKKVQRAFSRAITNAGITNFRFHDLRHCFCSTLRQRGVDLHTIAVLAGHKDLRMTKRYSHLNVESLRSAVSKLDSATNVLQSDEVIDAAAL